jgi:hypothetical protein
MQNLSLKWRGNLPSSDRTAKLIFCVHLVCACSMSGAKVQLFANNKFG